MRNPFSRITFNQKLILLTAVPLIGLMGIGGVFLVRVTKDYRAAATDRKILQAYAETQNVIDNLSRAVQAERMEALYLASKQETATAHAVGFKRRIAETDRVVEDSQRWLNELAGAGGDSGFAPSIKTYRSLLSALPEIRRGVSAGDLTVSATMAAYSRILFGILPVAEVHRKFFKGAEAINTYEGIFTVHKLREQDAMIAGIFAVAGDGYALAGDDILVIRKQYFALSESDNFLRRCFPELRQVYALRLRLDPASLAYLKYINDLSSSLKEGSKLPPFSFPDATLTALGTKRSELYAQTVAQGFVLANGELQATIQSQSTLALNLGLAIAAAMTLSLLVNLTVTRSLKAKISNVADEINSAAEGVQTATEQSTGASSQIATNATTFATALAQIGSAFRQINQTAQLNNEHTHKGDALALGANTSVESGRGAVRELGSAMDAIGGSSQKISKIVSRINELSFQTNILALNAAIEAARAGEAGAGFSVVAEEVRRLAHQCAAAADETNALIEESSRHATLAVEKSGHVSRVFDEISSSVREVGGIIAEISKNHREQTEQIGQANQAVIDQLSLSQTTSSVAEETGRSTELLQSQVAALTRSVQVLNEMVSRRSAAPSTVAHDDLTLPAAPRPLLNRLVTSDPAVVG